LNELIKIHTEEGVERDTSEQVWCATVSTDCVRTVCGYALDSDTDVVWDSKLVTRGGITCPACIDYIKQHKAYKF